MQPGHTNSNAVAHTMLGEHCCCTSGAYLPI